MDKPPRRERLIEGKCSLCGSVIGKQWDLPEDLELVCGPCLKNAMEKYFRWWRRQERGR